mmetsp:Transcript_12114/g.40417  ORF Transcript_12114/g.40417 Transcript_12114/m.40417 type:complete len:230 (-) Transcript_12114:7-696(-)
MRRSAASVSCGQRVMSRSVSLVHFASSASMPSSVIARQPERFSAVRPGQPRATATSAESGRRGSQNKDSRSRRPHCETSASMAAAETPCNAFKFSLRRCAGGTIATSGSPTFLQHSKFTSSTALNRGDESVARSRSHATSRYAEKKRRASSTFQSETRLASERHVRQTAMARPRSRSGSCSSAAQSEPASIQLDGRTFASSAATMAAIRAARNSQRAARPPTTTCTRDA